MDMLSQMLQGIRFERVHHVRVKAFPVERLAS